MASQYNFIQDNSPPPLLPEDWQANMTFAIVGLKYYLIIGSHMQNTGILMGWHINTFQHKAQI